MKIIRTSPFSGNTNSMEIEITQEQYSSWENGTLIQNAMPNISADEREFIMSGITPSEWAEAFGSSEEEDDECIGEFTHPAQYVDDNDSYHPDED